MSPTDARPDDARADDARALPQALRAALTTAIRGRDRTAVRALRSTISAVENAEAVEAPERVEGDAQFAGSSVGLGAGEAERLALTVGQVAAIVRAEIAERERAAQEFAGMGRDDRSRELRDEAGVIQRVLDDGPA